MQKKSNIKSEIESIVEYCFKILNRKMPGKTQKDNIRRYINEGIYLLNIIGAQVVRNLDSKLQSDHFTPIFRATTTRTSLPFDILITKDISTEPKIILPIEIKRISEPTYNLLSYVNNCKDKAEKINEYGFTEVPLIGIFILHGNEKHQNIAKSHIDELSKTMVPLNLKIVSTFFGVCSTSEHP